MSQESKKIVLIADDEDDIRDILSFRVSEAGYEVREARDGQEAFQILTSREISAVLCDLRMPKCDGSTLLKRVRTMLGLRVPFAFISADTSESVEDLLRLNSQAVFSKPFQMKAILSWLKESVASDSNIASGVNSEVMASNAVMTAQLYCSGTIIDEAKALLTADKFVARIVSATPDELIVALPHRTLLNGQLVYLEPSAQFKVESLEFAKLLQLPYRKGCFGRLGQSSQKDRNELNVSIKILKEYLSSNLKSAV
jgi:CheY-like chemotaxis protein